MFRFLPNDADIPPETLYDINPTYPKLTPNEWAIMTINYSLQSSKSTPDEWAMMTINHSLQFSKSIDNNTNTSTLTYSKDDHAQEIVRLDDQHGLKVVLFILGLAVLSGLLILFINILIRSPNSKKHPTRNTNRTISMIIGGKISSLSNLFTKRKLPQNDQDDLNRGEYRPLSRQHRWASESEESDLSDNEVFDKTDLETVVLRN